MQKIVLFIEPSDKAHRTPLKAGHLFMNRFAIDEDAGFEIINVLELEKFVERPLIHPRWCPKKRNGLKQKGMD